MHVIASIHSQQLYVTQLASTPETSKAIRTNKTIVLINNLYNCVNYPTFSHHFYHRSRGGLLPFVSARQQCLLFVLFKHASEQQHTYIDPQLPSSSTTTIPPTTKPTTKPILVPLSSTHVDLSALPLYPSKQSMHLLVPPRLVQF